MLLETQCVVESINVIDVWARGISALMRMRMGCVCALGQRLGGGAAGCWSEARALVCAGGDRVSVCGIAGYLTDTSCVNVKRTSLQL